MELTINDENYQLKFNFASLKLWEEKITNSDGDKQNDREMFDQLFTGLVQKNPKTLVDIFNGGLAYLDNNKPVYSEVFDAVSNLLAEKNADQVAQNLMADLTAAGFFKTSMGQWVNSIKQQMKEYDKIFKEQKPAKNASKVDKEQYKQLERRYQILKDQSQPLLDEFEKMLKSTGSTL